MELKELGSTGVMVPEIGLGTWKYRGGVEPLRRGIELGAFLVDTAEMYRTEDVVGNAISDRRDKVFLATKVLGSNLRYDQVMRAAEASLRRLAIDQIDLYQIHWSNGSVPISETMRAMAELVDGGTVKYIGVSNFSTQELREAQAALANHPLVSNQVLYNLKRRQIERDLIPYREESRITVMAYTPLADGSLTSKSLISRFRPNPESQVLERIASETGKTMAQVALNWTTARSSVIAIPKSDSLSRTEENCGASGWRLSPDQLQALDQAYGL